MKLRAYLDIETMGLSRNFSDITIIGIVLEKNGKLTVTQLMETTGGLVSLNFHCLI